MTIALPDDRAHRINSLSLSRHTAEEKRRKRGGSIIETVFCAAGRTIGHEREQEDKYALEGGSERGVEDHGVEAKGGIMDFDSSQQFCLKWSSFGTNLLTASLNLFKNESLTDVTLFCEGKSLLTRENAARCFPCDTAVRVTSRAIALEKLYN